MPIILIEKRRHTHINNLDKLRSVFKYYGTSFLLNNEIREYFVFCFLFFFLETREYFVGTHGIFDSEFRHKKLPNYEINDRKSG